MLCFDIVYNSLDTIARYRCLQYVQVVLKFTYNCMQDGWSVIIEKHKTYSNILPSHIYDVYFHSYGVSCFSSVINHTIQTLGGGYDSV